MRIYRALALFALTVGFATLVGDLTVAADPQTKKEKRLLKQNKQKDAANDAVPLSSGQVKPILGPVGPKDAVALAKLIDNAILKKLAEVKPSP